MTGRSVAGGMMLATLLGILWLRVDLVGVPFVLSQRDGRLGSFRNLQQHGRQAAGSSRRIGGGARLPVTGRHSSWPRCAVGC